MPNWALDIFFIKSLLIHCQTGKAGSEDCQKWPLFARALKQGEVEKVHNSGHPGNSVAIHF